MRLVFGEPASLFRFIKSIPTLVKCKAGNVSYPGREDFKYKPQDTIWKTGNKISSESNLS